MTTVIFQSLGAAVGGAIAGPTGAAIGSAIGAMAGAYVDQQLFGPDDRTIVGPRMEGAQVLSSREGAAIPRIYGRQRISGEIIWATRFVEVQSVETQSQGGKGGGSKTQVRSYSYFANFAIGLCEGEIAKTGRIWADGQQIEQSLYTIRTHTGNETQQPDSLIEAKQGVGNAPAYKGLAYIVFEDFPLEEFGNRIPQIAVEVIRPIGSLENHIFAVNLIPGATEFGYDPLPVVEKLRWTRTRPLNVHQTIAESDFIASLDELIAICPNLNQIALVVTWFGDDLRAGHCKITPRVEVSSRSLLEGNQWEVAGLTRSEVSPVSYHEEKPSFGGTPSDGSIVRAIQAIRNRGLKVCLNPFVMMDIGTENGLPDPHGGVEQPQFPWRGRITCDPAPQQAGTPDRTIAARQQVETFLGTVSADKFVQTREGVSHVNQSQWSYRRMILHYAHLADVAGGVDTFLIGSELKGLTSVRGDGDTFPFVEGLSRLANDVSGILGAGTSITYGADWSEYFGYQPADGSGDVYYNLDSLWANPSIGVIGIDNYMPVSDWRGAATDVGEGRSGHDPIMIQQNLMSGEGFDWYYASAADREAGVRSAITDGLNKPWVYRYKDIKSWWPNRHFDRRGGQEVTTQSEWIPESKPIIFTELGCPAVNNGAVQPNVFVDPKSSESSLPHFSNGGRNDLVQAKFLEAHQKHWSNTHPEFEITNNPISSVYGGHMVDFTRCQLWAWDARPFPQFPELKDAWGDADNWTTGHWLNGRLGTARLGDLIGDLLSTSGLSDFDTSQVSGVVDGYLIADNSSVRQALDVLLSLFGISVFEDAGVLNFRSAGYDAVQVVGEEDVVNQPQMPIFARAHEPEAELPVSVHLRHFDPLTDFQDAETSAARTNRNSHRTQTLVAPLAARRDVLAPIMAVWLHGRWTARQTVSFSVSKAQAHLTVGDTITLGEDSLAQPWRIVRIESAEGMTIIAQAIENHELESPASAAENARFNRHSTFSQPYCLFLDLPKLPGVEGENGNFLAATSTPWSGPLAVYASPTNTGLTYRQSIDNAAFIGELASPLEASSVHGRWQYAQSLTVTLYNGALSSQDLELVLNGANALAIECEPGRFEIIQFRSAQLIAEQTWQISQFLRGQAGTEEEAKLSAPIGARFVLLNQAVVPLANSASLRGLEFNWFVGPVGKALDGPSYTAYRFTPGYRYFQPYSPAHLTAHKREDLQIQWIRRDRAGADDWYPAEIPLSEDEEKYQISISSDTAGSIVRISQETSLSISDAELMDGFGEIPTHLKIAVSQLSETVGAGPAAIKTIDLHAV